MPDKTQQAEGETKVPAPHNLFEEVPKHRMSKIIVPFLAVLVIAAIGGGAYWYLVLNKPVTEQVPPAETKSSDEEVVLSEQVLAYLYSDYKFDKKTQSSSAGVFEIKFEDHTVKELFSKNGLSWTQVIGATPEAVYYSVRGADGYEHEIARYDIDTKKVETVVKNSDPNVLLAGARLSPDKSKIIYAEYCGQKCKTDEERVNSDIKLLDVARGKTTTLHQFRAGRIFLTHPRYWLNEHMVQLGYSCECDAGDEAAYIELLDVRNGNITTISFDKRVESPIISPDGKNILATRLSADSTEGETTPYTSSVVIKNIQSGEEKIVLTSTKKFFDELEWFSNTSVIGKVTNTEKIVRQLGYFAEGPEDLVIIDIDGDQPKTTTIVSNAKNTGYYGHAYPYVVYDKEWAFGQDPVSVKALSVYNFTTEDEFKLQVPEVFSAFVTK
jgi:hypothetical protein